MKRIVLCGVLTAALLPVLGVAKDKTEEKLSQKFLTMRENAMRDVKGDVGVLFMGDSITAGWNRSGVKQIWEKSFGKYNTLNFGIPGYATSHLVSYTAFGGLDGIKPKVAVILIGINNTNGMKETGEQIASDIKKIIQNIHEKLPDTKVIVTAIFPRGPQAEREETWENKGNQRMAIISAANKEIAKFDDGKTVRVLDLTEKFLVDGKPTKDYQSDLLHLSQKGYEVWAAGLTPLLDEMTK
jgi:lysophospholipase L1-like esterase